MPANDVPGDPSIDDRADQLTNIITNEINSKFINNLSLKSAKNLLRAIGHAQVELNFYMTTIISKVNGPDREQIKKLRNDINKLKFSNIIFGDSKNPQKPIDL